MKRWSPIGMLLLWVGLFACSKPTVVPVSQELAAVDTLMQTRPDSALRLLVDTPVDDPYYQLLLSEALYKNYQPQLNRAELLEAVAWYDSVVDAHPRDKDAAFLDARCHYMNGVGYYYEMDSVVPACAEYLKAVEIMESLFEKKELVGHKAKFMAYVYDHLGYLYYDQLLVELATVCFHEALSFCRLAPSSKYGVSTILYNLGIQFDIDDQKDSAVFYYDKALAYLPDYDNVHYRDIMVNKALLDYNSGQCLDSVINDLIYLVALSEDEEERLTRFLTIGSVLYESKLYDSALFYLETVFKQKEDKQSKVLAAENLCSIFQMEGDSLKAQQYKSFLSGFTLMEIEKHIDVSKMNKLFEEFMGQKLERQAEKARQRVVWKMGGAVFPIVLVIASIIFFATKHKSKRLLKKKQEEVDNAIEREKKASKREKKRLQQDLQQRNEQVKALEKAMNRQRKESELRYEIFLKESICCKINNSIRPLHITARDGSKEKIILNKEDSVALREAVLRHYENFETVLLSKNPKMNEEDLKLCRLYLIGLDERQIAVLLCKSYSAVKKRSVLLKDSMGITESLPIFIMSFFIH